MLTPACPNLNCPVAALTVLTMTVPAVKNW
jgi:hypothetical protein